MQRKEGIEFDTRIHIEAIGSSNQGRKIDHNTGLFYVKTAVTMKCTIMMHNSRNVSNSTLSLRVFLVYVSESAKSTVKSRGKH
jgi:hypothetical protein